MPIHDNNKIEYQIDINKLSILQEIYCNDYEKYTIFSIGKGIHKCEWSFTKSKLVKGSSAISFLRATFNNRRDLNIYMYLYNGDEARKLPTKDKNDTGLVFDITKFVNYDEYI